MPCELLIKTTNKSTGDWFIGDPVTVRDVSELAIHPWGTKEGLPEYIKIRITDRSASQVQGYISHLEDLPEHVLYNRRYYIDPALVATIVSAGGYAEYTASEVQALIKDRGT